MAIYVGARANLPPGERLPWNLFALGLLGQVAGDAIFAVYEIQLNREPPSPSVADVFYLAGYPLLALGDPRPAAQARQPDEPRRDPRHRDRLLRGRARAVGVLHRSLQPPALRDRGRAARCDGLPGSGRAAPGCAHAAPRRPRRPHHRVSPLARERRALGGRRRDLRPELRHVRRRRPGRRALARLVRGLGRRCARTVDGSHRAAGAAHAAAADDDAPHPARGRACWLRP